MVVFPQEKGQPTEDSLMENDAFEGIGDDDLQIDDDDEDNNNDDDDDLQMEVNRCLLNTSQHFCKVCNRKMRSLHQTIIN